MCKVGDIILISQFKDGKNVVGKHPFLVLDDTGGIVRGTYNYDFIALLMSSNTTIAKHKKLNRYLGNFPIAAEDKMITDTSFNNLDSYIIADQFYYFDKSEVKFIQLGSMDEEIYNLLIEFMNELKASGVKFRQIVDNASEIKEDE